MQATQLHFVQFTGLAGRRPLAAAAPQPSAAVMRTGEFYLPN